MTMPIHKVYKNGRSYWQWGLHGHEYPARSGALRQAAAAHANNWHEPDQDENDDRQHRGDQDDNNQPNH